jgi:hypothetical protein
MINAGALSFTDQLNWQADELMKARVCPTCPYKWVIAQRISMRTHLKRKEVDDVLGGKDSWANVDSTDGEFPVVFYLVMSDRRGR